ncbi:hypothetical protein C7974DRAFT_306776 [Boeremia exigua]|uniref:uncharacterized protein n=1 Tax=Boeremia exigua TaxID=749465 RepID=UPI001E8E8DF2|nr:uncharacterized protein C7974DRAFT_306776 [Boeremia exigua]KAH6637431.1 hypothetical protein C7974DRAFT_306776 [Boeremia exigua]
MFGFLEHHDTLQWEEEEPYSAPRPRTPFRAQKSRTSIKATRRSRPLTVLDSIHTAARNLYSSTPPTRHRQPAPAPPAPPPSQHCAPTSVATLLARYLDHLTTPALQDEPFICTQREHELLQRENLTQVVIQSWALSLLETNSNAAAAVFQRGARTPPLFLLSLFLRREHIRIYALGVILNHLSARLEQELIPWSAFRVLMNGVLRHARKVWPESLPWISTVFLDKAAEIHGIGGASDALAPRSYGEITQFCNNLLSLLSLPASHRPMIAARHQENAQFRVLQFMARYDPSIAVTRTGFRALARIQLTHAKTEQERDWAELKGPWWPPWKESKTAMDDEKGYEYGASRASKILHRMFEAGYAARGWEEVAEVYAGWDTDLSPTIQTRALLPFDFRGSHTNQLWAARIRTTRTRREAWACFLAHEASGASPHEEVYLAMFEKLHFMEIQRQSDVAHQDDASEPPAPSLLPGDMKEVSAEPHSPLHNVFLGEPVPSYEELYHRMTIKKMRPRRRLLAFLLETHPDFATMFKLLEKAKDDFDGGVGCLLTGTHDMNTVLVPDYFLAAFIRFLCRFGHPTSALSGSTTFLAPDQHLRQFMFNENYRLEYAYALLLHYKPRYQPAWTAFMERVVFSKSGSSLYHEKDSAMGITNTQYSIVVKLLDTLASVDVDVEGDLFDLACTATRYAAQAVHRGTFSFEQGRDFLRTRSYRLRTLFHHLVGASADPQAAHAADIPPHIPGPAQLHAYVRALGILRDYEGLYSFSTWLTTHNAAVIARARAQHGGSDMLFRALVALRAATGGWLEEGRDARPAAPADIAQLIKAQIASVPAWGGWPSNRHVALYISGFVRSATPSVGGR